jgi:hypothetical protein
MNTILSNDAVRKWRRLPLVELEALVHRLRCDAAHRHLSSVEWRRIDRMRKRLAALRKAPEAEACRTRAGYQLDRRQQAALDREAGIRRFLARQAATVPTAQAAE